MPVLDCKLDSFFPLQELDALSRGEHTHPHQILGLQQRAEEKRIFLWRPDAENIYLELFGQIVQATCADLRGLFYINVPLETTCFDYRVYHTNGHLAYDPYAFAPSFHDLDAYLFNRGVHYELYRVLGAQISRRARGCVEFSLWAPQAQSVSLVGDFNYWNGRINPMSAQGNSGVWSILIPGLCEGEKYKYEIRTDSGKVLLKSDPFAFAAEKRPNNASIVFDLSSYSWKDREWLEKRRREREKAAPANIYEVHLPSWRKRDNEPMNYRDLAQPLAQYCKEMGFTHVEFMPITEYPLDESWGYQVTGFYAVTSRQGTPRDFQYLVDTLHQEGIFVLLDWVAAHFPNDAHGLSCFDGSHLYEHCDEKQRTHPHWQTSIFNYGRNEVSNFLLASALFWLDVMHIDGLRVDAVASILYLDYGKEQGQWVPNRHGGNENLEAIEWIKHLNSIVQQRFPEKWMIAEESTSFPKVTEKVDAEGLGFTMKWNMGWMNDTLRYFCKDPIFRSYHQHHLTFGLLYAFSERFVLVLSHDEVVHGKKSLLSKMPGDTWQKFAQLRLLYSYMICQPGKNLLFMGGELGEWDEWNCAKELNWGLLKYPIHSDLHRCIRELNHFSLKHRALWERDFSFEGFEWLSFSDSANSVISYQRKAQKERLVCVHNFTPNYFATYCIPIRGISQIQELFNSDAKKYGGSGKENGEITLIQNAGGEVESFQIQLAPLATQIFSIK